MGKPGQTSLEFPSRDASPSAEWLLTETDGQAAPELARCDTALPALADVSSCACAGVGTRAEEGRCAPAHSILQGTGGILCLSVLAQLGNQTRAGY